MRINQATEAVVLAKASQSLAQFRSDFVVASALYQERSHLARLQFNVSRITPAVMRQVEEMAASLSILGLNLDITSFKDFVACTDCSNFENLETLILTYLIDAVLRQNEAERLEAEDSTCLKALLEFVRNLNLGPAYLDSKTSTLVTARAGVARLTSGASGSGASSSSLALVAAAAAGADDGDGVLVVAGEASSSESDLSVFCDFLLAQWGMELKAVTEKNEDYIGKEYGHAAKKYESFRDELNSSLVRQLLNDLSPKEEFFSGERDWAGAPAVFEREARQFIELAKSPAVGFKFKVSELCQVAIYAHESYEASALVRAILMVLVRDWHILVGEGEVKSFTIHFNRLKCFVNALVVGYAQALPWLCGVQHALNEFLLFDDRSVVPTLEEAQAICIQRFLSRPSLVPLTDDFKKDLETYIQTPGSLVCKADGMAAIQGVMQQNISRVGLRYAAKLGVLLQRISREFLAAQIPAGAGRASDEASPLDKIIQTLAEQLKVPVEAIQAEMAKLLSRLEAQARREGGVASATLDFSLPQVRVASASAVVPAGASLVQSTLAFFGYGRARAGAKLESGDGVLRLTVGVNLREVAAAAAGAGDPSTTALVRKA